MASSQTPPEHALFQSTLLMRGATLPSLSSGSIFFVFQSTLLMRGATQAAIQPELLKLFQSTLLMRGATTAQDLLRRLLRISIHAPHARSDWALYNLGERPLINFNPRSSCEERHVTGEIDVSLIAISIHAPHARSDGSSPRSDSSRYLFQSTLLMRGATPPSSFSTVSLPFQSTLLMRGAT